MTTTVPRYDTSARLFSGLLRHFADLRDMSHGDGAVTRHEKEQHFRTSADLLSPVVHEVLDALNGSLLQGQGTVDDSGAVRSADGGLVRDWTLGWAEQERRGIAPVHVLAYYGAGFHHPHLRGGTVGEWPFNVFDADQAALERGTIEAIVAAEIHNLVFEADFRIVPATTAHAPARGQGFIR